MSSERIAISVDGLGKKYRLGSSASYGRLTESLASLPRRLAGRQDSETEEFWALRDINFVVTEGQIVGIVGHNGAGKSTLLKILSRVTRPTEGKARVFGRVGSLLEVGTGFHRELTGRENIYMSGAILGMRRQEITERFDAIVEFADIGPFLDTPVKRYSSGMQVRLGFAVAAYLDTEVLLVDEVLAVGDFAFQRKCLEHISKAPETGKTILLVSHNLNSIRRLCSQTIVLDRGTMIASGQTQESLNTYLMSLETLSEKSLSERNDRHGSGALTIKSFHASSPTMQGLPTVGHDAHLAVGFRTHTDCQNVIVGITIYDIHRQPVLGLRNDLTGEEFSTVGPEGTMICHIPRLPLIPGEYTVNIYVEANGSMADWIQAADRFEVLPGDFYGTGRPPLPGTGSVLTPYTWLLAEEN